MNQMLTQLNPEQRSAVTAPMQNLLILAGAGSGKTRVLVQRIAWLIQEKNVSPFSILAVTFTNKAANEMKHRIEALLGTSVQGMWIGTFHSLAHRLLRTHWREANLSETFQILDQEDQKRLIKRVMREHEFDEERWPPKQVQWYINNKKDQGLRAKHCQTGFNAHENAMISIYQHYESACEQAHLVDFAELLLRSHELWLHNETLLKHYQERFQHILIDEFQDTNAIQYAWIRMIAKQGNNHVMVVGDDDQSIYSWRGACVENIRNFERDFPNVQAIRLEQNYRSTSTILNAANALIDYNQDRYGKKLWTDGRQGDAIELYCAYNEIDEARFIADQLAQWHEHGESLRDAAILYRSNAQSRILEEALLQKNIAYRIYGGFRFFERAEIKDALAYLRLITNPHDDPSFDRIINVPTRGMGHRTVEAIREHAQANGLSLWAASQSLIQNEALPGRALNALKQFVTLINTLTENCDNATLDETIDYIIDASGLILHYQKERGEAGRARVENLRELVVAARQFDFSAIDQEDREQLTPVTAFLAHAALEAGEMQARDDEDSVKLMTLHAAKGLEFPFVIIAGLEEGLFPHQMCLDDPLQLEEERRLCYVGITRAMQKLILTYAESRRTYGSESYRTASRFIHEIPPECLHEVRQSMKISRPMSATSSRQAQRSRQKHSSGFYIGQTVTHAKFGEGTILEIEGHGESAKAQIRFRVGTKWLMLGVAKLSA
ncbi:MAG: DNA helicase II [Gammaproteobacteria bacterium]